MSTAEDYSKETYFINDKLLTSAYFKEYIVTRRQRAGIVKVRINVDY
jgi:hypothetical protein